jgi:predicted deacetylase
MFNTGNFNTFYQDENSSTQIDQNKYIVEYIKEKINDGLIEIMLHGYNHLYSFECDGVFKTATKENLKEPRANNKKINFLGEYNYQDYQILYRKTKEAKEYLEDLFQVKIVNFVPPSNQINDDGVRAVVDNGLNISGLIGKKYNREKTIRGAFTYFDRVMFSILNKNVTYPKVANYGKHKELTGYALTPTTNWNRYENQLKYCLKHNLPFQLATHYWEIDGELKEKFYNFINKSIKNGMESKFLKEVLV